MNNPILTELSIIIVQGMINSRISNLRTINPGITHPPSADP